MVRESPSRNISLGRQRMFWCILDSKGEVYLWLFERNFDDICWHDKTTEARKSSVRLTKNTVFAHNFLLKRSLPVPCLKPGLTCAVSAVLSDGSCRPLPAPRGRWLLRERGRSVPPQIPAILPLIACAERRGSADSCRRGHWDRVGVDSGFGFNRQCKWSPGKNASALDRKVGCTWLVHFHGSSVKLGVVRGWTSGPLVSPFGSGVWVPWLSGSRSSIMLHLTVANKQTMRAQQESTFKCILPFCSRPWIPLSSILSQLKQSPVKHVADVSVFVLVKLRVLIAHSTSQTHRHTRAVFLNGNNRRWSALCWMSSHWCTQVRTVRTLLCATKLVFVWIAVSDQRRRFPSLCLGNQTTPKWIQSWTNGIMQKLKITLKQLVKQRCLR